MVKANDLPPIPDGHPHVYPATPASTRKYPMPTQPSIELRDWFAGMAMQALITGPDRKDDHYEEQVNTYVCKRAYIIADTMIKAREAK